MRSCATLIKSKKRTRLMPVRAAMYRFIAVAIFPSASYAEVMHHLTEGLRCLAGVLDLHRVVGDPRAMAAICPPLHVARSVYGVFHQAAGEEVGSASSKLTGGTFPADSGPAPAPRGLRHGSRKRDEVFGVVGQI